MGANRVRARRDGVADVTVDNFLKSKKKRHLATRQYREGR